MHGSRVVAGLVGHQASTHGLQLGTVQHGMAVQHKLKAEHDTLAWDSNAPDSGSLPL